MANARTQSAQASFGIDGPNWVRNLAILALLAFLATALLTVIGRTTIAVVFAMLALLCCLVILGIAASSKVVKPKQCRRMIEYLQLDGSETILDVGCGRGLLLIEVGRRLSSGTITGVDIWIKRDQSGNTAAATRRAVISHGLEDKAEVLDADARQLPFEGATFDVVVSSLTLHNIPDHQGRETAIQEMARVLKPEGKIAILDMLGVKHYTAMLRARGLCEIRVTKPFFLHFAPGRILIARKPASSDLS